ncbi:MAG: ATP-dependent helicase HrpB, partial [Arcobacteraceae bacterium]|nr:ATP-dependent helicase HrpB [Arcobacteraceae bacterium]
IQRGGRAGRLSNGKCYKLWHKGKILIPSTKPEILRTDLSSLILDLSLWGVDEFEELKWLDIPQKEIINNTKEILEELNMIDNSFGITTFGKEALTLGIHPRYSYMILKASDMGYGYEACLLSSMLSEKDIFNSNYKSSNIKERFIHLYENDLNSKYINKYVAKEILKQAKFFYTKLQKIKKQQQKVRFNNDILSILLLFAYPDRLAKQRKINDSRYKLSNAKGAKLSEEDTLFNEPYLVIASLNAQNKDSYINLSISISLDNIEEYFSHFIKNRQTITFNKTKNRFDIKEISYFLELELSATNITDTSKIDFQKLMLDLIQKEGLKLLPWSKKATSLKDKINFINQQQNLNYNFPDFSDDWLLTNLDSWLAPYLQDVKEIKDLEKLDIYSVLLAQINWENQQLLDTLLPKSIKVPSGSNIYIDYSSLDTPVLSVKIQEIFGMMETPKILNNTIIIQIHLLSPAMRPIQITYDLKSFWENSYEEVRKELRGTYKRHYWPENPYDAIATNKTKKNMDKNYQFKQYQ